MTSSRHDGLPYTPSSTQLSMFTDDEHERRALASVLEPIPPTTAEATVGKHPPNARDHG